MPEGWTPRRVNGPTRPVDCPGSRNTNEIFVTHGYRACRSAGVRLGQCRPCRGQQGARWRWITSPRPCRLRPSVRPSEGERSWQTSMKASFGHWCLRRDVRFEPCALHTLTLQHWRALSPAMSTNSFPHWRRPASPRNSWERYGCMLMRWLNTWGRHLGGVRPASATGADHAAAHFAQWRLKGPPVVRVSTTCRHCGAGNPPTSRCHRWSMACPRHAPPRTSSTRAPPRCPGRGIRRPGW